jgi:RHS repeat-associated protein
MWYDGTGTIANPGSTDIRHLFADERGSIVLTQGAGTAINTYDEYGAMGPGNIGRIQYTGQMAIPAAGVHHYKARTYNPDLGRFLQTDPIGYADGMNLYAYVGGDPVNFRDPSGMERCGTFQYETGIWDPHTEKFIHTKIYTQTVCFPTGTGSFVIDLGDYDRERGGGAGGGDSTTPSIEEKIFEVICSLPSVGFSGGLENYKWWGGTAQGGLSFNPRTGELGIVISLAGGVGFEGGGYFSSGTFNVPSGQNVSISANLAGRIGASSIATSYGATLLGSGQGEFEFTGVRDYGAKSGRTPSGNASVSLNISSGGPKLYKLECENEK